MYSCLHSPLPDPSHPHLWFPNLRDWEGRPSLLDFFQTLMPFAAENTGQTLSYCPYWCCCNSRKAWFHLCVVALCSGKGTGQSARLQVWGKERGMDKLCSAAPRGVIVHYWFCVVVIKVGTLRGLFPTGCRGMKWGNILRPSTGQAGILVPAAKGKEGKLPICCLNEGLKNLAVSWTLPVHEQMGLRGWVSASLLGGLLSVDSWSLAWKVQVEARKDWL